MSAHSLVTRSFVMDLAKRITREYGPDWVGQYFKVSRLFSTADLLSHPPTLVSDRLFGNRRRQVCKVKTLYPKRRHVRSFDIKMSLRHSLFRSATFYVPHNLYHSMGKLFFLSSFTLGYRFLYLSYDNTFWSC